MSLNSRYEYSRGKVVFRYHELDGWHHDVLDDKADSRFGVILDMKTGKWLRHGPESRLKAQIEPIKTHLCLQGKRSLANDITMMCVTMDEDGVEQVNTFSARPRLRQESARQPASNGGEAQRL